MPPPTVMPLGSAPPPPVSAMPAPESTRPSVPPLIIVEPKVRSRGAVVSALSTIMPVTLSVMVALPNRIEPLVPFTAEAAILMPLLTLFAMLVPPSKATSSIAESAMLMPSLPLFEICELSTVKPVVSVMLGSARLTIPEVIVLCSKRMPARLFWLKNEPRKVTPEKLAFAPRNPDPPLPAKVPPIPSAASPRCEFSITRSLKAPPTMLTPLN